MTREELLEEIDRNRKWLCDAGYTAYNIDVAFASIYRKVKELEQEPCEDWYDIPSSEMTLEQARQALKELRKKLAEHIEQKPTAKNDLGIEECVNKAEFVKKLENETMGLQSWQKALVYQIMDNCHSVTPTSSKTEQIEDCVSRQAVDQNIYDYAESNGLSYTNMKNYILDVPPVTPAMSGIDKFNDSVNRATVLRLINDVKNADGFKEYSQYEYLFDQVDKMPAAVPTIKNGVV
jgi:hypothetical protein